MTTADVDDSSARQVIITGGFEPEFFDIAKCFLIKNGAVFDVGANAGFCTSGLLHVSSRSDLISFHLFEANGHLCEMLQLAKEHYPDRDVFVNHACVSDCEGLSMLHLNQEHWGGAYITSQGGGLAVKNIVLDDYIRKNRILNVSLMKMDIEGYELHAIRGCQESIVAGRIGAIYLEVSSENLARQGSTPAYVIELLQSLGCRCYWCKDVDFRKGLAGDASSSIIIGGSTRIRVAPLYEFPTEYQTDILAIPKNGCFGYAARDRFPEDMPSDSRPAKSTM